MAIADGTYEIRYANAPKMAVDVNGASAVKGANVQLYSVNHSNAQVFYIDLEDTDSWSIRNVYSGMYVDVNGAAATRGTNVQQWTDNDSRAQRWKIYETGDTMTVDGVTCPIVRFGSYVTEDADTYYLDVNGAMTTNKTNVQIWNNNGTAAQVFALYPTTKQDTHLPVPSAFGWSKQAGSTDYAFQRAAATTLYPAWLGTQSWASNTANGFEGRWRERTMDSETSTWGDWGDMTAWADLTTTRDGTSYWLTAGLPATLAAGDKTREYEFQLRAFAGAGTNRVRGLEASMTLDAVTVPVVTLSTAAFGPDGLRIPYTSDYDGGTTNVRLTSIVAGGQEMLARPVDLTGMAVSGNLDVPSDALTGWVDDGATLAVTYQVGNDQTALYPDEYDATVAVSYDAGSVTVTPTLTAVDGRRLKVEVGGDVTGAWYRAGGVLHEAEVVGGVAYVDYPFGEFDLFVSVDDGTDWGVAHVSLAAGTGVLAGQTPCHAWGWDGGTFLLECDRDPMVTDRTITPISETMALNGREYQNVYFQGPIASEFAAVGLLFEGVTESTRAQMLALSRAHHVTYRAPSGEVATVAVTSVAYRTHREFTEVEVNMVEETW